MPFATVRLAVAVPTLLGILCFWTGDGFAHPRKKNRIPTKAAQTLKQARAKMDQAKAKLTAEGKYACCVKPTCDMCAAANGSCNCAVNVSQGKGSCGECLEGWQSGKGALKGIDAKKVTLLTSDQQAMPDDGAPRPPELDEARALLNQAKRTMAGEGNYSCCVRGGCDSCAHEGNCSCGVNLAEKSSGKPAPGKTLADEGVCGHCYDGWHAGKGAFDGYPLGDVSVARMEMDMPSSFGVGTMFRQGSGTSWIPESSQMYATMKDVGSWMVMTHPYAFANYSAQTGPRRASKFFSGNWFMASAQREVPGLTKYGNGTFMVRGMFSLDPVTVGRAGYPLLFQTGESNRGRPLVDRQHPHDLVMELAMAYSAPISKNLVMSLYVAPVGEPALGPSAFPHRLSAMENPEAPLGHHWQDSTHIASGVVTLGIGTSKWKIEGSSFTGAEPNENRWNFDRPKFDSWSTRFSVNPTRDLSMQVSYGSLKEPEALEPGVNIRRITASAAYNRTIGDDSFWATSFIWGRNEKRKPDGDGYGTNAFLVESTYFHRDRQSFFMRFEHVGKDELFLDSPRLEGAESVPGEDGKVEIFPVKKFTLGAVQNLPIPGPFDIGIGASVGFHAIPGGLKPFYGNAPVATNVFLRFRVKRWGQTR